jgi:hypothetical protein
MGSTSNGRGMTDAQSEKIIRRLDDPSLERKIRIVDDEEVPTPEARTEARKKREEEGVRD